MNWKLIALLLLARSPSAFAHEGHGTIENLGLTTRLNRVTGWP